MTFFQLFSRFQSYVIEAQYFDMPIVYVLDISGDKIIVQQYRPCMGEERRREEGAREKPATYESIVQSTRERIHERNFRATVGMRLRTRFSNAFLGVRRMTKLRAKSW